MKFHGYFKVLACASAIALAACGDDDENENNNTDTGPTQTIAEIAAATPELSQLVSSLTTEQADLLGSDGTFTVFAPTNAAFTALTALTDPTAILEDVVNYHVVAGEALSAADVVAMDGMSIDTALTGSSIDVSVYSTLDGSIVALNGVIQVTTTDIEATNGVVHLIDGVLLPEALVPEFPGTIFDLATTYPIFSAIAGVAANDLADNTVVDALQDATATHTLFAPFNPAVELVASALEENTPQETQFVVLYHAVLNSQILSTDLTSVTTQTMANGEDITVDTSAGVVLNGAVNVIAADITCSNGVVHMVDQVLLPPTP